MSQEHAMNAGLDAVEQPSVNEMLESIERAQNCHAPMSLEFPVSLRDYFAAKAMQALIGTDFDDMAPCNVSWEAYRYADAMLAARENR